MLNLTLSSLYVAKQSISPLFTSKIAYNIKKSSFNFQISPIFVRFSPISISNTQFKKFTSSVIRISSDETVYSDIYTKRIVILNPQNSINITSSVFVSIRSDEEGGGLKIYRGPNESPYLITMKQTKFYNCTSQSSAGAFAITDCPIEMSKVCITHSTAKEHSGFIVSTDSLICNSSFIRQCHSKDSSEGSVKIDADDLLFSNFNFTLPNDNAITNEKAIDTSFLSSDISYVSVDQWFSPIIFKFSIQKSSEESSIIQNINFNNVSASTALVELSIASTTAKLEINNFTRKDTSFETAFISNDLIQPILVSNSMFDKEDVNTTFITLDNDKYDRNMGTIFIDIGYGPGCYNTPPPLSPKSDNNNAYYFIGIAGVFILVVIGGIAYTVLFVIKKPRAFEESTQMQNYGLLDKFGETRITA